MPGEEYLPTNSPECFERTFRDDFNELREDWVVYDSDGNAGFGVRSPEAVSVSGGNLTIRAEMKNGELVSGGISYPEDQKYGLWVLKVRIDKDPSGATSGVALLWPKEDVEEGEELYPWPEGGETNIFETITDDNGRPSGKTDRKDVKSFVHYGKDNKQKSFEHPSSDGSQ